MQIGMMPLSQADGQRRTISSAVPGWRGEVVKAMPMKTLLWAALACSFLGACGGGDSGSDSCATTGCPVELECQLATKSCVSPSGTIKWALSDGCPDGVGIQVRYFDATNGGHWPADPNGVFTVDSNQTAAAATLACIPGSTICYGAEPNPTDGTYWGRSLDGTEACDACCAQCGGAPTINLTCK